MKAGSLAYRLARAGFSGELKEGERMSAHTSLRVGGPAALLALPDRIEDLVLLVSLLGEEKVPWMVLGGGTNVMFANGGFPGCVIRLPEAWGRITRQGNRIEAGAAAALPVLVLQAAREGLAGLEALAGIPGTVGGAVRMNAGTKSGRISDAVSEVRLLDGDAIRWVEGSRLGFSYRSSGIREGQVVLGARFTLRPDDPDAVRERIRDHLWSRRKTQPSGAVSAGCWFRNPEGDSAGRLIDEAGLKGLTRGGAKVSNVHANFLVNTGSATAADFLELAAMVRQGVRDRFGVDLEEEVRIIHD